MRSILIGGILILYAILFYIGFRIGRQKTNIERLEENRLIKEHNQRLESELIDKQQELTKTTQKISQANFDYNASIVKAQEEYSQLINDLTIAYKNKEAEYALKAAELSHNLNTITDMRFSKINEAATKYREKLYDDIQITIQETNQKAQERQAELLTQLAEIQTEIIELQSSRDALIEANRREEELRLQKDFYKIAITEKDLQDIRMLKSIEQYLYNKDPLYKLIWSNFYLQPVKEFLNRIIGKNKTSGIYKITNQLNQKVYIGQSVDLHNRLTNHIKAALGIGTIAHQLVHDAMAAEGLENFTFEIVEKCEKEQLNKKEKLWIETYASDKYGYNRTAGGAKEEKND